MQLLIPFALWCAWWLWGVNWKKTWPVLAAGGWVPAVLLMLVTTLVWSHVDQTPLPLGAVAIPNVWWQLCGVCALAAVALFCGWLQGYFGWTPPEISLEPPAEHDDHAHDFSHHEAHPSHNGPAHH
jgi:hypothetical protein